MSWFCTALCCRSHKNPHLHNSRDSTITMYRHVLNYVYEKNFFGWYCVVCVFLFYTSLFILLLPYSLYYMTAKKPVVTVLNFNCHGRWTIDFIPLNFDSCDVCHCTGDQEASPAQGIKPRQAKQVKKESVKQ